MKNISFLFVGILFGIIMTKSEAISWFRIHEMFRFESIHMYGIMAVAVGLGVPLIFWMKKSKMKTWRDTTVAYSPMKMNAKRYLLGGSIFGLGWALMGACPGPMFVMLGHGFWIFVLVILGALLGTFVYGMVRERLPH